MGDDVKRLADVADRLEKTIGRFCVLMERQLNSDDHARRSAQNKLAKLHPEMASIQADVQRKAARRRLGK
jgi:hypothetical protein